jgi:predicted AAA+ superfamily ATPase
MAENKIDIFYKEWIKNLPKLSEGYIYNGDNNLKPSRFILSYFKEVIRKFLTNRLDEFEKIILIPGIRNVGKTTLLMQIFKIEKFLSPANDLDAEILNNFNKLDYRYYFDVSRFHLERISLYEFLKFFQEINKLNFVTLDKKIILLLDEVHFDERWSLTLKVIFDSTKAHQNLLIIATGSSAINLKISADLMRRVKLKEIHPMKFNEYLLLKYNIHPIENLTEELQRIFFLSQNAEVVYSALRDFETIIDRFFINLPLGCEDDFFNNGGFPFVANLQNDVEINERIQNVIDGIIMKDIITLKKFRTETISKINDLLFLLSNSDIISYEKLLQSLRIDSIRTLTALLDTLEISGIIRKVRSYGQSYGSTRKTPKYLFITPSLRNAILNGVFPSGLEGKKLEDYFVLIYEINLKNKIANKLFFDIAEGGADFILNLKDRTNIVIELGFNKEETFQVEKTMKKVKNVKYGLVFGSEKLELVENSIVKIPLKFLLLI